MNFVDHVQWRVLAYTVLDLGASTSRGIFYESCSFAEKLSLINNLDLFRDTIRFIVIPSARRMFEYSALILQRMFMLVNITG